MIASCRLVTTLLRLHDCTVVVRLSTESFAEYPEVRRIFMRDASSAQGFEFGDLVRNPELAATFRRLAQVPKASGYS